MMRRGGRLQEDENDGDHQHDRDEERGLHVVDRLTDRNRTVVDDLGRRPTAAVATCNRGSWPSRRRRHRRYWRRTDDRSPGRWRDPGADPAGELVVFDRIHRLCATSLRRTGAPLRQATTRSSYCGGMRHLAGGVDRDVLSARPACAPTGVEELAAATTAFWILSRVRPRAAALSESTSTRTANFCWPNICTCATPVICEICCANTSSA